MLRDEASSQADHQRFIQRVIAAEAVWGLKGPEGFAYCESHEDEEKSVLVFWSDRAYAARAQKSQFPECEPEEIPLFDFLFRWLPGMSRDGALAGTNWSKDLVGLETDPDELADQITEQMPREMLDRYLDRLKKGLEEQRRPRE
jgi:hypothetical protein